MITAIIIDDEQDGRETIQMTLEKYCPEVAIAGIYATPAEGIAGIRQHKPSLVFLDIQMPEMSGFDVLLQLSPVTFDVIFVSAYDRYAIKAIKFSALDYLLKPIDVDDLVHAVKKVKDRLQGKNSFYQYQSVLHNIQSGSGKIEKLAIPSLTGIDFFDTADIIYCRADGSYTTLFLKNKQSCLVSRNLKDFENMLADSGFCRVHHSFLINLRHVQKYIKGEGGYVILTGNHHVDISRRKKDEFLAMLDTF
ncbi:LytTR family DNA-binding domain-containing protein [Agriterribacter sp.]|uniref:LytR/AlgR family response regulator transcription factor n=1 Tax=Agriterribacter sp. TaxID=2821509 RepID=UPI002BF4A7A6|nr:LytTR family DNA-binding domain-containing protein [Agriterribacter sp.]HRO47246.1 LytTR family DNA-binding domain-containing protein [Agriterribacter sp.]HRQ19262.1 LytTR family DNA-binding domain-containing protein [Agriterribacter sp.]